MNLRNVLLMTAIWAFSFTGFTQVITTTPVFPKVDDNVTLVFDAAEGNKGLEGFTGTVYAHTGVITNNSTSSSDWKYVKGTWGTTNAPEMTSLGGDKYSIDLNTVRSFYGVPGGETILKIGILFRNAGGTIVGRAADGGDIFVDIYSSGLFASVTSPQPNAIFKVNDLVTIEGGSSATASLKIWLNGSTVATKSGTSISHSFTALTSGNYTAIVEADNGSSVARDTVNFVVNPSAKVLPLPAGLKKGINYTSSNSITLVLYAPFKEFVYVLGDFNDWKVNTNYFMNKTSDNSTYWLEINGLTPGQKYALQYLVDGEITIADPYSELVLDPNNDGYIPASTYPNPHPYPKGKTNGVATLIEMAKTPFNWTATSYNAPDENKLVVYELLVRDFVAKHDYNTLLDTLDYLQNLGINAIELMPVNEFEGNESWGYNPSFHMALDKYYGTPEAFKRFIDECHKRGIAVILDAVFNHAFSQSPLCQLYWDATAFKPAGQSPFLNRDAKHDFNVGYDFNHESPAFRDFMKQVITYWLTEYKVDGFRFDLSKGFTQNNTLGDIGAWGAYDASRVANIKRIYDEIKAVNADAYVILEHFADNSEEKDLANYGCMLWGSGTHDAQEAVMGYPGYFNWLDYKTRGWNSPKVIAYPESHDEERLAYKALQFGNVNGSYSVKDINTALDRIELLWVVFGSMPGPKMTWQFMELGYDYSIDYNGRIGNKPIKWEYNQASNRRDVYKVHAAINKLKTTSDAFSNNNYSLDVEGRGKRVFLNGSDMQAVVMGNFDVSQITMIANFQHTGKWYEYFSGDSMDITDVNKSFVFAPGAYMLWTDKYLGPKLDIGSVRNNVGKLEIYPNPVLDDVIIYSPSHLINKVAIYNQTGQLISEQSFPNSSEEQKINTTNLATGIYFIDAISTNGFQLRTKFVKN